MPVYQNLIDALAGSKERGFTIDFNLEGPCITCTGPNPSERLHLYPEEFQVVEVHRFDGQTDPDERAVLYMIESNTGLRGTFLTTYGTYVDGASADMLRKLGTGPAE